MIILSKCHRKRHFRIRTFLESLKKYAKEEMMSYLHGWGKKDEAWPIQLTAYKCVFKATGQFFIVRGLKARSFRDQSVLMQNIFKPDHTLVISLGWQQLRSYFSLCIEKKMLAVIFLCNFKLNVLFELCVTSASAEPITGPHLAK